jgi:hypothetical protein
MRKPTLTRRAFTRLVAGGLLTGGALEAAAQEQRSTGRLSDETAATLLDHIGYSPTLPHEMEALKPMLESVLRDLETIRDFEIPLTLEPAFIFRADR